MDPRIHAICTREGLPVERITPLAGGQVNQVFQLDDAILRIGQREGSAGRFARETDLLRRLEAVVPVPRVLACGVEQGLAYQVQRRVAGQPLYAVWNELSRAGQSRLVAGLAEYRRALSMVTIPDVPPFEQTGASSTGWQVFCASRFHQTIAEIHALGLRMRAGFLARAQEYFTRHEDALAGGEPDLVHGDLWLGNILVHQGKITAILDFEYAMHAPADYELHKIEDFCLYPNDYVEDTRFCASDFAEFLPLLRQHDPRLFAVSRLRERVNLYHLTGAIADYLAWRKDNLAAIPPGRMAAANFYMARISNTVFDNGIRLFLDQPR